ncbi:MAG: undecaprenyl-diphosphate phosphatase, partial [Clostridia bacterium]|nr:undecaprenyl-diphosphate phosphatase [Clostridia bacterium]
MLIWVAIVLGLIQGFTEFLPVSSSGHLVIAESILGINMNYNFLNVLLHISTLLAVIIYYRKKILYLITHPTCRMNRYLLIATIPAVILVLLTHSIFGKHMENTLFVGIGFLLTAVLLSVAQIVAKRIQ